MVWETAVQSLVESYQSLKKVVLDATLLNTQHLKVRIIFKVEQFREWSSAPYNEKGAFESTSTKFINFTFYFLKSTTILG